MRWCARPRAAGVAPAERSDPHTVSAFREAMDDDLGTPEALAEIFKAVRHANSALDSGDEAASALLAAVIELTGVLGIDVTGEQGPGEDDEEIEAMVDARTEAKAVKDWVEADRIRDELAARGITIEDTPTGTTWRRS